MNEEHVNRDLIALLRYARLAKVPLETLIDDALNLT